MDTEQDVVDWIIEAFDGNDRRLFGEFAAPTGQKHGKPRFKSLDCSIMDVADDISYGVHDLEDVIALSLVSADDFEIYVTPSRCSHFLTLLKERYPAEYQNDVYSKFRSQLFGSGKERKHAISRMVGYFVPNCVIQENSDFTEPLLKFNVQMRPDAREFVEALKALVVEKVIRSPAVQHLEFKGQQMVVSVFETFASDPVSFLPPETLRTYKASGHALRVICDHVAGMTDAFLLKTFERLFSPRIGSVFDRI